MAELEFFWDPVCPWAWITSRWVVNVIEARAAEGQSLDVDWKFICLRIVNEAKDYEKDFSRGYERGHMRGMELLRVAAAVRAEVGRQAMLPLYTAYGRIIHNHHDAEAFDAPSGVEGVLQALDLPVGLAAAATSTAFDDTLRRETAEALERCGGNIGTPVLSFDPPEGPSFFGPVISKAPKGADALELWDAVTTLGTNPYFSELKRSTRSRPQFDD
ncbi:MAG TPA: hypothetical protein VIJ47_07480 [Acidimicrobiales bacterium]